MAKIKEVLASAPEALMESIDLIDLVASGARATNDWDRVAELTYARGVLADLLEEVVW